MSDNTKRAITASLMLKREMGADLTTEDILHILSWPLKNYSKPFLAIKKIKGGSNK